MGEDAGTLAFEYELWRFVIDLDVYTSPSVEAFLDADYSLDGSEIFTLSITAPPGFSSPDDLEITYRSRLGSAFGTSRGELIRSQLAASPGHVGLRNPNTPLVLFPLTDIASLAADSVHSLAGGQDVGIRSVPEPTSLALIVPMFIIAWRCRRIST
jgi:hypothetical protein